MVKFAAGKQSPPWPRANTGHPFLMMIYVDIIPPNPSLGSFISQTLPGSLMGGKFLANLRQLHPGWFPWKSACDDDYVANTLLNAGEWTHAGKRYRLLDEESYKRILFNSKAPFLLHPLSWKIRVERLKENSVSLVSLLTIDSNPADAIWFWEKDANCSPFHRSCTTAKCYADFEALRSGRSRAYRVPVFHDYYGKSAICKYAHKNFNPVLLDLLK